MLFLRGTTAIERAAAIRIREATAADAPALALLAERSFRDTYGDVNTPANMELHCGRRYGAARQAAEIADPDWSTLLAEIDGTLAAYAQLRFGVTTHGVDDPGATEVHRFYVDRAWHGRAVAQALMQACVDVASGRISDSLWLGVWQQNPRAIAFYRKQGFQIVGEQSFLLGTEMQKDHVMVRRVDKRRAPTA